MILKEHVFAVPEEYSGAALEFEQEMTGVAARLREKVDDALKSLVAGLIEPVNPSPRNPSCISDVSLPGDFELPTGPKGQKRPADVIGNAIKIAKIAKIATGEIEDNVADDGKDPAAKALGAKGGAARAIVHDSRTAGRDSAKSRKSSLAKVMEKERRAV